MKKKYMIDEKKIETVSGGVPDEALAEIEAWQNGQSETKSMDTFEFVRQYAHQAINKGRTFQQAWANVQAHYGEFLGFMRDLASEKYYHSLMASV
jgi:hypothetical protein